MGGGCLLASMGEETMLPSKQEEACRAILYLACVEAIWDLTGYSTCPYLLHSSERREGCPTRGIYYACMVDYVGGAMYHGSYRTHFHGFRHYKRVCSMVDHCMAHPTRYARGE